MRRNIFAFTEKSLQDQAFQAWSKAENVLQNKLLSSLVSLQMMGSVTIATVAGETGKHTLKNVLDDWGCCSCKKAMQQQICYHHVLALLASFPQVKTKDFSDMLMRSAGRRFGADGHCHRGLGGMTSFSNRLKEVELAMTEAQGTPILQQRELQSANVPAAKLRMAQELMMQLHQQKSHSTSPNLVPADVHHIKTSSANLATAAPSVTSPQVVGLHTTDVSQQGRTEDMEPPRISDHEIHEAKEVCCPMTSFLCALALILRQLT
jgi:hypothetical protein